MNTISITLRQQDAEPILRRAAYDAAYYGSWCDYITPRTYSFNLRVDADAKKRWRDNFLRAKRLVEAFGIEYEQVSEEETLTVYIPFKNEKRKLRKVGGFGFTVLEGGVPDYDNPQPAYRGTIHTYACHAAAERVVRRWRAQFAAPPRVLGEVADDQHDEQDRQHEEHEPDHA
jgi:hypothetical protein